ncbi:MAG TPA: NAD-dependent epimerase [Gammaproteobacteria bacterium]|nr:NAD-dependent epimerase [Gammaproteobacteria bacterium]
MKVLVTGAAGFIGFHTAKKLLERGDEVVGLDNINEYYDPTLKRARLAQLEGMPNWRFLKLDLVNRSGMTELFKSERFERVVHLAAQAGVRYSIENPMAYVESNLVGYTNLLEACRHHGIQHLVYASTSSVYGANTRMPFSVHQNVDHPLSFYAASKKANELMAHTYSALYQLPTTGLRFFTVYGPWGRPDMALFKFTKAMLENRPIEVYNYGHHRRDFTYIDDIVEGVVRCLDKVAAPDPDWNGDEPDPGTSFAPYRLYNIGNQGPIELMRYIEILEQCLEITAEKQLLPMQAGDVPDTWADVQALVDDVGYRPATPVEEGVRRFVDWYLTHYEPPKRRRVNRRRGDTPDV